MISILVKRNLIDKCSDYEHFFYMKMVKLLIVEILLKI